MTAEPEMRLVPVETARHAANNMRVAYHKTRLTREVMVSPDDLSVVLDYVLSAAPDPQEGEAVAWRIENDGNRVMFWVGVQGFTVATKGDDPDGDKHLELMERMLRKALTKISAPDSDLLKEAVGLLRRFDAEWNSGSGWAIRMDDLNDAARAFLSKVEEMGND